jgi:Na+/H+-dicarboxylate symporter
VSRIHEAIGERPGPSAGLAMGCLLAGLLLGTLAHGREGETLAAFVALTEAVGGLWIGALRMVVLPLVVCLLFTAVAARREGAWLARAAGTSLACFVALLLLGAAFALLCAPPLIAWVGIGATEVVADPAPTPAEEELPAGPLGWLVAVARWIAALFPPNVLQAAANDHILGVIVFTVLLGLAATRIPVDQRDRLVGAFEALGSAVFVIVGWVLRFTAPGVFALAFTFAARSGVEVAGLLFHYTWITCALLLAFTLLLYPIAVLVGRVPARPFARSLYRGQVVAVATRSSLASLPALLEGARRELPIPERVTGFVMPFAASVFKVNRTVSSLVTLLFLERMNGLHLGPGQILAFVATVVLLSFSTLGIPSGGLSMKTLPVYLSMGIRPEGYVLLRTVDVVPDVFKTLLNATGYTTAAALVARFSRVPEEPAAT